MITKSKKSPRWLPIVCLSAALVVPQVAVSEVVEEEPTAVAMVSDLLLVRPALLAITAVGSVAYVASLPFSLIGGNADKAAEVLVLGPANNTFVRCLGCTRPGYKRAYNDDM